jgi:hypothetical protein
VYPLVSCASSCVSIAVQLVSAPGAPFGFTLPDGDELTTFAVTTVAHHRLPGQKFIQAYCSDLARIAPPMEKPFTSRREESII